MVADDLIWRGLVANKNEQYRISLTWSWDGPSLFPFRTAFLLIIQKRTTNMGRKERRKESDNRPKCGFPEAMAKINMRLGKSKVSEFLL